MAHQNESGERPVDRIEIDRLDQLRQVIEQAAERGAARIQLGEGPGAIVLAEADRSRWRKCGDCTLCCTVAGVNELKKPPMTPCRHLAGKGCGIHATKPGACRDFACGWLLGNFDERFRPDKVGAYAAFFVTEAHGVYAMVQCDSRKLNRKRLGQMVAKIRAWVPEVRIIVDDKHGLILHAGQPDRRFRLVKRDPGDYETAVYMVEEVSAALGIDDAARALRQAPR